jgi:hypothetical protein
MTVSTAAVATTFATTSVTGLAKFFAILITQGERKSKMMENSSFKLERRMKPHKCIPVAENPRGIRVFLAEENVAIFFDELLVEPHEGLSI